jgi:hypothetical protein
MQITDAQIRQFETNGFFLTPNPLSRDEMRQVDQRQQDVQDDWASRDWPAGVNKMAGRFLMLGELVMAMAERPAFLDVARRVFDCEHVRVIACGAGDAHEVSPLHQGLPQIQWHCDGVPGAKQLAIRTAIDRHDETRGPLRVLPGSHHRDRDDVATELQQLELATGAHDHEPQKCFARHPDELQIILDPRWTLLWTPSCWHATGPNRSGAPRRAFGWNYGPAGAQCRDVAAVKHVYADQWQSWPEARQRLWGLLDG